MEREYGLPRIKGIHHRRVQIHIQSDIFRIRGPYPGSQLYHISRAKTSALTKMLTSHKDFQRLFGARNNRRRAIICRHHGRANSSSFDFLHGGKAPKPPWLASLDRHRYLRWLNCSMTSVAHGSIDRVWNSWRGKRYYVSRSGYTG